MRTEWRNVLAGALLLLGSAQMIGDVAGLHVLRGIGAASAMAPYPKVFTDVDGLETFASRFTLYVADEEGGWRRIPMTPDVCSSLRGSYKRRNVYGAALSFGPRLPEELWRSVYRFGFGEGGPLRGELGLPETGDVFVLIETATRGRSDRWVLGSDEAGIAELSAWLDRRTEGDE